MARDDTLGTLLQGVSQQPATVREPGKVTEQINFISDVVDGLTVRPATSEKAVFHNYAQTGLSFKDIELDGVTYIVGYKTGFVAVWDTTGVEYTVTATAGALSYLGADMQTFALGDTVYMVNRDKKVLASPDPVSSPIREPGRCAVAFMSGGKFSRTYQLRLQYMDGTSIVVSYDTPDGTTSGDAEKSSAGFILRSLRTALIGHADYKGGTTSQIGGYLLLQTGLGLNFKALSITEDDGSSTIVSCVDEVDGVENLPALAPNGYLLRVTNYSDAGTDDFYMRFRSNTSTSLDGGNSGGFGQSGTWEEWYNTFDVTTFNLTTMPHVLTKTGATTFTFQQGGWLPRGTGDEETNPFPDFVGKKIRDIGAFQSRLVFVAGPSLCMSRTNAPLDFFKQSAVVDVDSDPINIASTEEAGNTLDWIVGFDRNLVIMSDPGKGQFLISGDQRLTPANASMVKSTSFEMVGSTKPVQTGSTVLFPFKSGQYSGIKEFVTNIDTETNSADTITETLDKYIVGTVTLMASSTTFNVGVLKTDGAGFEGTVWVYKYLWNGREKLQSAWSKWVFTGKVEHFFFRGSEFYVLLSEDGVTPGTKDYIVTALDMGRPVNTLTNYVVSLDRMVTRTADSSSRVVTNFTGGAFIQSTGCAEPGREVSPTVVETPAADGTSRYTFNADTVPSGATLICGVKFERLVKPTMPYYRNPRTGRPVPRTHIVVSSFLIDYVDTAYLEVLMESPYRDDAGSFVMEHFPLEDDPIDTAGTGIKSGVLDAPWGERNDWSELVIKSNDIRPTTILEIEWVGEVFKGTRQ